jgi:chromosome segregation ATPase
VDLSRDMLHTVVTKLRAEYNAMHKTAVGLRDNRDFWKEVAARRKERCNYLAGEMRKYREEAKALREELDRVYARLKHTDAVLLQSRRASGQLREELELARKTLDQSNAMLTCNDATRDMLYASRSRKNDLLRQCRVLLAILRRDPSAPILGIIDAELARKD